MASRERLAVVEPFEVPDIYFGSETGHFGESEKAIEHRIELAIQSKDFRSLAALSDSDLKRASIQQRTALLERVLGAADKLWTKLGLGSNSGIDTEQFVYRLIKVTHHPDELDRMMNSVGARRFRDFVRRATPTTKLSAAIETLRDKLQPGEWGSYGAYLEDVANGPSSGRNSLKLILDEDFVPEISREIQAARESIDVQLFVAEGDAIGRDIIDQLIEKARKGVRVRVIFDEFGTESDNKDIDAWISDLRAAGGEIHLRPSPLLKDHLDHRKIWVVDGKVGFTGGMNLGQSYHSEFHDQQTRVEGPAVGRLESLFEGAWKLVSDKPSQWTPGKRAGGAKVDGAETHVVSHTGGRADENIKFAYLRAIRTAEDRIRIASPYFTDKDIADALSDAARRGVRVEVVFPRENDRRYMLDAVRIFYDELLEAGVHVFEQTEKMVHLKVATFDGKLATVGSSNLDARSLEFNDEANLFVLDESFTQEVDQRVFDANIKQSEVIHKVPEDAPKRIYRYILRKAMDLL